MAIACNATGRSTSFAAALYSFQGMSAFETLYYIKSKPTLRDVKRKMNDDTKIGLKSSIAGIL